MNKHAPRHYFSTLITAVWQMMRLAWAASPANLMWAVTATAAQGLIPIANAWIIKRIIDVVSLAVHSGGSIQGLVTQSILTAFGAVLAFSAVTPLITRYSESQLARQLGLEVREQLYSRLNGLHGLKYFEDPSFYDNIRLAEQGAQNGPTSLFRSVTSAIRSAATFFGFFGVVAAFSVPIAALLVLASLPQMWIELKFGRARLHLAERTSPLRRRTFLYGYLLAQPLAAKEIRALDIGQFLLGRFLASARQVNAAESTRELTEAKWKLLLDLLTAAITVAAVLTAINMATMQLITIGDVTLVIAAVGSVVGSISGLLRAFAGVDESVLFFDKAGAVMGLPETIHVAPQPSSVPAINDGIEIENVSFRYAEDLPWLLKGTSFRIPAGKSVALVGVNGAGKSTLVKLLLRMYDPDDGAILWDGQDVRAFEVTEYRTRIGVVFQDFLRFDMSVGDNIGIGKVHHLADRDRLEEAARAAGLHETIAALPSGYDTFLSRMLVPDERTRGTDFSGGQWQKLAVARMYFRDGDFLILDEPTASMDVHAEQRLFEEFMRIKQDKTTLIISHRFSTSRLADYIAVLDGGRIVEYGCHEELLGAGGYYSKMYTMHLRQNGLQV